MMLFGGWTSGYATNNTISYNATNTPIQLLPDKKYRCYLDGEGITHEEYEEMLLMVQYAIYVERWDDIVERALWVPNTTWLNTTWWDQNVTSGSSL